MQREGRSCEIPHRGRHHSAPPRRPETGAGAGAVPWTPIATPTPIAKRGVFVTFREVRKGGSVFLGGGGAAMADKFARTSLESPQSAPPTRVYVRRQAGGLSPTNTGLPCCHAYPGTLHHYACPTCLLTTLLPVWLCMPPECHLS